MRRPYTGGLCTALIVAVPILLWNAVAPRVWPEAPHLDFWATLGGVGVLLFVVGGIAYLFRDRREDP